MLKEIGYRNLDEAFYDLIENGYIYDEDENGRNMSYGEYAAVSDFLRECIDDYVSEFSDFEQAIDAYSDFVNGGSDDSYMFAGLSEEEVNIDYVFSEEWFGNNLLYVCYDEENIPDCLKDLWDNYKDLHEGEYEEDEEEEVYEEEEVCEYECV